MCRFLIVFLGLGVFTLKIVAFGPLKKVTENFFNFLLFANFKQAKNGVFVFF